MKRLNPDVAISENSEQAWIDKYRAVISEPTPQPLFRKIVGRLAYVVGIILGKAKGLNGDGTTKTSAAGGTAAKSTRKRDSRKRDRGSFAA